VLRELEFATVLLMNARITALGQLGRGPQPVDPC
jgi:hypothetical protein